VEEEILIISTPRYAGGTFMNIEVFYRKDLSSPFLRDGLAHVPRASNTLPQFVSNRLTPTQRSEINQGLILWEMRQIQMPSESSVADIDARLKSDYAMWSEGVLSDLGMEFDLSGRKISAE